MPRERVHHGPLFLFSKQNTVSGNPQTADEIEGVEWVPGSHIPPDSYIREEPSLDVHWGRDNEYVQVSIHAPTEWWDAFYESKQGDDAIIAYDAFIGRLSRREINDMIKVLRRARDSAYGSDE